VFVINADDKESHELKLDAKGFEGYEFKEHIALYSDDPDAYNDYENPEKIVPQNIDDTTCKDGVVCACLKPMSWNVMRFIKK